MSFIFVIRTSLHTHTHTQSFISVLRTSLHTHTYTHIFFLYVSSLMFGSISIKLSCYKEFLLYCLLIVWVSWVCNHHNYIYRCFIFDSSLPMSQISYLVLWVSLLPYARLDSAPPSPIPLAAMVNSTLLNLCACLLGKMRHFQSVLHKRNIAW